MEDIKAFETLWNLLNDEQIESFSYNSITGFFDINVEIGHEKFEDWDKEKYCIQLDGEDILKGELEKEIQNLKDEYYESCVEAYEEEYGAEKPLLKHYYADGQLCADYL